ncbi:IS66 family insertion sequence element accessory protein TnpB [Pseudomonas sp. NPDC098747]|uniref:IS66 family insertion sequence element accessory protein TnpB n=1 Tax=Pseudomonas sp. NPDC098747 TaxID=3364487 RepID=UPI003839F2F4
MRRARCWPGIGYDPSAWSNLMLRFDEGLKVWLHRDGVDFRKSINGLAALVEQSLRLDSFAQAVYVFRNRRADRIAQEAWPRAARSCTTACSHSPRIARSGTHLPARRLCFDRNRC